MQYYYTSQKNQNYFSLSSSDEHHIINVLRMKSAQQIIVNFEGRFYLCKLLIENKTVKAEIIEEIKQNNELDVTLNLIIGVPKGEKLSLIVQKAVELGVTNIYLFDAERSIAKINDESKLIRYQKIIKEAGEQSHRNYMPNIFPPLSLKEIANLQGDIKLVAYEEEASSQSTLFNILNTELTGKTINVVIGPEGGLSQKEVKTLNEHGYLSISLGKRILRCETACIDVLAIIAFMVERT